MSHLHRKLFVLLGCTLLFTPAVLFPCPEPQDVTSACNTELSVKKLNSDSVNKETQVGRAMAKEVERTSRIIDDPATTQYLNHLAENLARNSEAPFPIKVKIIQSDAKNEVVLPGGFLYINDGLFLEAETESELAGALSYGIAYSTLRCGAEQPGSIMQIGSMAAWIFEPYSWIGYRTYEGMNLAIPQMNEQRKFVLAADGLGLKYLYQTGYDPSESATLLQRISLKSVMPKNQPNALSPFPPLPIRLDCMRKEIAKVFPALEQATISSSEFENAKGRLTSLKQKGSEPMPLPELRKPAPSGVWSLLAGRTLM